MKRTIVGLIFACSLLISGSGVHGATGQSQTIHLDPGLNLIAFQVLPNDPSPSAVFGGIGKDLLGASTYDNQTKTWMVYRPAGTEGGDPNQIGTFAMGPVQLGRGYWITLNGASRDLKFVGTTPDQPPPLNLSVGWNLMSVPAGTASVNIPSTLAAQGVTFDMVLRWDNTLFSTYIPTSQNLPFTTFDPGKGYWVHVTPAPSVPFGSFVSASSTNFVGETSRPIRVHFTSAIFGRIRFLMGGTALFDKDYTIVGATRLSTTTNSIVIELPVNGTNLDLTISPKDSQEVFPDRSLTLALLSFPGGSYQAATNGPVTHPIRHVAYLTESSLGMKGIYTGTLYATNNAAFDPQPIQMALRRDQTGSLWAYFDTTKAPFFGPPFALPAEQSGNVLNIRNSASGSTPLPGSVAGRSASWSLSFPFNTTLANGVLVSQFRLDLSGITASGRTSTILGNLTLAPLN